MRRILTNPLDTYHSQIEIENFKEEQQQKKEFMDSIKRIADSAEQKAASAKIQSELAAKQSKKADVKGWISVVIAFVAFLLELCERLGLF